MPGMTGYTVAWIMWLVMFAVIEGAAIFHKDPGRTLSEHVWRWFSVKGKPRGYKMRRFALLTFMGWLTTHFLTGGWV